MIWQRVGLCTVMLIGLTGWGPTPHVEKRCGWFDNPTPGNVWLTDRYATWELSVQGGHEAEGDHWPAFDRHQFVATNGVYGYSCACVEGVFAAKSQRVLRVTNSQAKPLAACRADVAMRKKEPCPANKVKRVSEEDGAPADYACERDER